MNSPAETRSVTAKVGLALVFLGLIIALVANAAEVRLEWNLFDVPRGTEMSMMSMTVQSMLALFIAGGAAVTGLPASVLGLILNWRGRRWPAILGIIFSLTPIFVNLVAFRMICASQGLTVEE